MVVSQKWIPFPTALGQSLGLKQAPREVKDTLAVPKAKLRPACPKAWLKKRGRLETGCTTLPMIPDVCL